MSGRNGNAFLEVDVIGELFQLAKDVGDFACDLRPYVEEENCTEEEFVQREAKKYEAFCVEDFSKRCPALYDYLMHQKMGQEAAHYLIEALSTLRVWCQTMKKKDFLMEKYREVHELSQDFLRVQSNLLCYVYFYYELYEGSHGMVTSMDLYCRRCKLSVFQLTQAYHRFFPPHPDQWTVSEQMIMGKFSNIYPNAFYFASNHDIMPKISEMEYCLEYEVEEWNLLEELKSLLEEMYEEGELDIASVEELEEALENDEASMSWYLFSNYVWTDLLEEEE